MKNWLQFGILHLRVNNHFVVKNTRYQARGKSTTQDDTQLSLVKGTILVIDLCDPPDHMYPLLKSDIASIYRSCIQKRSASSMFANAAVGSCSMCVRTRVLLRLVWPASRLTCTPLARRRWQRSIHQNDVTIS